MAPHRLKILLVDDQAGSLLALEAALQGLGPALVKAQSGVEAIQHLLLDDFAVIVLDVRMPEMDGFETAARIREGERSRHTPIIFLTGLQSEENIFKGYGAGAVDYLLKPVAPEVLRSKVAVFVELARKTALLARAEERYRELFENASDVIYTIDLQGNFTSINRAAEQISGYSREEALGMNIRQVVAPEHLDLARQIIEKRLAGEESTPYELAMITKDGRKVFLEIKGRVIFQDQKPVGIQGIARDITERKQAEDALRKAHEELETRVQERTIELSKANEALRESSRLKDEFLATISHELRTPLTAILGWSRMLRSGKLDESAREEALEIVIRNAQTQARLIEEILDVSRIITGKFRLDARRLELPPLIESAMDALRPAAEAKGVRLQKVLDLKTGSVLGDPERLQQVIWNLLSNAIKFTPAGGSVEIGLHRIDSLVELTVSDTGQGIRADFLPHVFEHFRQADSSTTRAQGGLGLGLAIVRHLVGLHGGTVRADSPGEGQGATFTVTLPLIPVGCLQGTERGERDRVHALRDAAHDLDCPPVLDGLRVLVVDDEADARRLLTTVLNQCQAAVTTAASTTEALEALEEFAPDVLVADIGMPGEDGYALIRQIRARESSSGRKRISAIALTAYAGAEDRQRALKAGYHIHLAKPIDPGNLVMTVASLVERNDGV